SLSAGIFPDLFVSALLDCVVLSHATIKVAIARGASFLRFFISLSILRLNNYLSDNAMTDPDGFSFEPPTPRAIKCLPSIENEQDYCFIHTKLIVTFTSGFLQRSFPVFSQLAIHIRVSNTYRYV